MEKLTEAQAKIIEQAKANPKKDVAEFTLHIPTAHIRQKILDALENKGLICKDEKGRYRLAKAEKQKAPKGKGKTALMIELLTEGATVEEMTAATGWQQHSVRGVMSNIKKGSGRDLEKIVSDGRTIYRLLRI